MSLAAIAAVALAVRVAYVLLVRRHPPLVGDAYQFHYGANLLADGKGFIDALGYKVHLVRQSAQHPPVYTVFLALPSFLGLRSFLDHQLWSCLLGTATVVVVGLAGRRIAGDRAGLIAAAIAAVYPNLWLWDGLVLSETMGMFVAALVVLFAYRFWQRPSTASAVAVGLAGGVAALTRAEAALFLPAMVVPLALWARHLALGERLRLIAWAGGVAVLVVSPWVLYNLSRFNRPTIGTSTDFAQTLVLANCDRAYHGDSLGSRSFKCLPPATAVGGDETDTAARYRAAALDYIGAHLDRVPVVVLARVGRVWGVYRPLQQLHLDVYFEHRDFRVAQLGYGMYWFLALAAVPGALTLRRRGVPITPFVAIVATVTLAAALTFGQTRYRTSAEVALVLLAAVWADSAAARALAERRPALR